VSAPAVAPVEPEQIRDVAAAIARGFDDNEIWVWLIPDDRKRIGLLTRRYTAMIKHVCIPRGGAWATADLQGAALWTPPGRLTWTLREQLHEELALLPGLGFRGAMRGRRLYGLFHDNHPTEPHYYLDTLSIDPEHQRRGYGSALLAPLLERADAERMPVYLETQRYDNVPFYGRFGFDVIGEMSLPDAPSLWKMWREPATRPPPRASTGGSGSG
jgi:GNAT superfamily N-acetyltransferase